MNSLRRWQRLVFRYASFYARNLWHKAARDQIFFLSSGITFNVLVTIVPLLLITISVLGILVESSASAREQILTFIQRVMPLASAQAESLLFSLVDDRGWFGVLGLVGLIWASTRLFGSLRTVLEVIFEIPPEERLGIVEGKIHDIKMVVVVGSLFLLTISLTAALRWVKNYGVGFLGLDAYNISWIWSLTSLAIAFVITFLMFFFVYRYVPDRWIPRQDAAIAALFCSVLFEVAKQVFVYYLAELGRFLELYGSFTNLVAVSFWVYYSSIVFILGGELGRIVQVHRGRGVRPGWSFREVSPGEAPPAEGPP
ncbi:MAG TPA: YihY/virulence factor BrkB family protein [Gemmatimonadota bacterium]|nr:YihY/virulence factor BrkB family protein [Gemmatimonadota bacterium]